MEDEARSLPDGWIRQYDQELNHQFFVDTTQDPPRSIWHHPYDDDQYMSSLTPIERRQIEGIHRVPSDADIEAETTDEDSASPARASNPPAARTDNPTGIHKLGRKMKDKLTSSTHPEREARRRQREQQEADAYRRHQAIRSAMARAARTGEPQLLGKDRSGKDVYIEPPFGVGLGRSAYPAGGYGFNPFAAGVQGPFWGESRPYAGGYGGGWDAVGDGVGWGVDVGGVDDLGWGWVVMFGLEDDCGYDDNNDDDAVFGNGSCDLCCSRVE
ncbi:hypothetical protein DID88_005503 [Monilinia fructigena]|uniref:WW domain-containing protein n=1 Tax=Monilinia fructigena TaxID=38457 RepID=A0A395J018_9HELO|nr:hypothetical protein DID88_005503 [Monilinia fructigena]